MGLEAGHHVKTSQCYHNKCNCNDVVVNGFTVMYDEPVILVAEGCKIRYFSQLHGREMGSRRNAYKDGCLSPWYLEDQESYDEKVRMESEKGERAEAIRKIRIALGWPSDMDNQIAQYSKMSLAELQALAERLESL